MNDERQHCESAAKQYLAYERLPPHDEEWHLATHLMQERAAARAEERFKCQAETEQLRQLRFLNASKRRS